MSTRKFCDECGDEIDDKRKAKQRYAISRDLSPKNERWMTLNFYDYGKRDERFTPSREMDLCHWCEILTASQVILPILENMKKVRSDIG